MCFTMTAIQQIKQKLSCVEYLQRHGIFVKNGGRCVSPLREGAKNPTSFFVDNDHFFDFGSGYGGDVVDLAALLKHNGDISAAVLSLSQELGIETRSSANQTWREDIQRLCNRTAAYHEALTPSDYEYLSTRGLTPADAERLMIGRVTDGYLKGRLFLPYFKNGGVFYYATRSMPGGSFPDNKYMKASKTECDSYQHIPWGLQTLNRTEHDTLIISEGYFDAAVWETNGYPVISPITGNFSKDQWPDVINACRMFKRVLIIFDNDDISHAGDGFTARTAARLFKHRIPFLVSHTPPGIKDVNDYYTAGGSLEKLVDTAQAGLNYITSKYTDPVELKKFIMTINRFTDSAAIAAALFQPVLTERFAPAVLKSIQKSADSAPTESQIVDEIIEKHNIIYVDQVGFYEWDSRVWSKISDGVIRNYADILYGKKFATAQRVNAVCNLLKSRSIRDAVFDRNPVLTFKNGTLEIETGRFRTFSETDYCSIGLDYDYDPDAKCPMWVQFIKDITGEDSLREDVLQTMCGYVLYPDCRFQKIFILVGGGSNGKSLFLEVISKLFGDNNVSVVMPSGLTQEFQRVRLKDSLVNIGKDVKRDFSSGEIREWLLNISDGTKIQACYKGQTHFDFSPRCKLIYSMNKPPIASMIEGLERRFRFVRFPCSFVDFPDKNNPYQKQKDVNLFEKLLGELPGIFNWTYEGYKILNAAGYFTDTIEQSELTQQFIENSDPVSVFCNDYDTSFHGTVERNEIYNWYKAWCEDTGHKPLSRENFMPQFREQLKNRILEDKQLRKNGVRVRVFDFD